MPGYPTTSIPSGTPHRSHLFTVRLWLEDLGDGRSEWRGKAQHVLSGEARYFRDWETLEVFMVETAKERA